MFFKHRHRPSHIAQDDFLRCAYNDDAVRFESLTFKEVLDRELRVMDLTAITMCMDNDLPINVVDVLTQGNLARVVAGEPIGTTVTAS